MPKEQKIAHHSFAIMADGTIVPMQEMAQEKKAALEERIKKRMSAVMSDFYRAQHKN